MWPSARVPGYGTITAAVQAGSEAEIRIGTQRSLGADDASGSLRGGGGLPDVKTTRLPPSSQERKGKGDDHVLPGASRADHRPGVSRARAPRNALSPGVVA